MGDLSYGLSRFSLANAEATVCKKEPTLLHQKLFAFAGLVLLIGGIVSTGVPAVAQVNQLPPHVPGRILVRFRTMVAAASVRTMLATAGAKVVGSNPRIGVQVIQLPANANLMLAMRALASRPDVLFAELDEARPPEGPNDPYYSSEWHLAKIAAPLAWNTTSGSSSVIVAVLDTGCDPTHPDLASKYVPGWNTFDANDNWADVYGHGTAVAGTVAAATNNGVGVASVAGGCRIMPIRISSSNGTGYFSTMATGLTWAADHGARVANISYQASGSATVAAAAQYFMSKGGVVTMAAGNYSTVHITPDNPYVLTVSATSSNDTLASFSDSGSDVDVCAPGVGIYTTNRGGTYGSWSGTSFAAPVTAGVAALVLSANPGLTGEQAQDIIKQSADDLGAIGPDSLYASGRVNAGKAVSLALGTGGTPDITPPTITITNPIDGAVATGTVSVNMSATDAFGVASVSLYLDGTRIALLSEAPFTYSWNTMTIPNGFHVLRAMALDVAGNSSETQISVDVQNLADTVAPTVVITSPTEGSKVSANLTVTVNASDACGVVKVELWVDGKLQATDATTPWTFTVNTKKWLTGSHSLVAKGYDEAGNVGTSVTVGVRK